MSGFGEMGHLLKQAQEMTRQVERVKKELREKTIEGQAGGGVVRIELSGDRQEVRKVEVSPDVARTGDPKLIEDLMLGALQDALRRAEELQKEEIGRITGGMHLPGLF